MASPDSIPPQDAHMVVRARDVTLELGRGATAVSVLRGVSLDVAAGARVAILGPSGSGKSSLMAVLAGLESPTAGHVRIAGQDLAGLDENGLARMRRGRVGVVLQAFHLIPTMTALENVAIPVELAGGELAGGTNAMARAAAALRDVGLGARLRHYPAQLSGGEQQRVALARALVVKPALLFADEPTGNLDFATGQTIVDLLFAQVAATGATLILITHDRELASRCDRIVTMRDGAILSDVAT